MKTYKYFTSVAMLILMGCIDSVVADGNTIDKVYQPYINETEVEIEWRAIFQNDDDEVQDDEQVHRLGIGYAWDESFLTEIYLIGENSPGDSFKIEAVEVELLWQLTEQGEYDYDWGLLFELEREVSDNVWEFSTGLLIATEWGKWTGVANLFVEYEWGDGINDEVETAMSLQLRYRYKRIIEPAIEFYQSEKTTAIGPVLMGNVSLGAAQKLFWQVGVIFGLKDETPNQTIKVGVEYEF
jgi:hypothetical protein